MSDHDDEPRFYDLDAHRDREEVGDTTCDAECETCGRYFRAPAREDIEVGGYRGPPTPLARECPECLSLHERLRMSTEPDEHYAFCETCGTNHPDDGRGL